MLFKSLTPLGLLLLTKVNAVQISTNTLISTGDTLYTDDYTIDKGVYLAIDSGYTHNFYGDLTINGMLYISDKNHHSGLTCDFIGTSNVLTNYGELVLNDLNGTSAPTFDYYGGQFYNYGNVWFAGIGNTGGSTFAIQPYGTFVNEGTITFYQSVSRSGGTTHLGLDDKEITNDGTVCLYQHIYFQGSNIDGTGCYDVGLDSVFWVTNAYSRKIAETQTILLSTSSSSLRIDLYNPSFSYKVAGWGNGNTIGFSGVIKSFQYNVDTLTIVSGGFTYTIVIGTGYDQSKMAIGTANFGMGAGGSLPKFGLIYSAPPPDSSRPSVCAVCPSIPSPPNGKPNGQTTSTSTWTGTFTSTTTKTATQGGTDTVIVEVPTNSQTTQTSTWTGTYTTLTTVTATQGGTDTVIVEVPTSSKPTSSSIESVTSTKTETLTRPHVTVTITTTWTGTYLTTITAIGTAATK